MELTDAWCSLCGTFFCDRGLTARQVEENHKAARIRQRKIDEQHERTTNYWDEYRRRERESDIWGCDDQGHPWRV